MPSQSLFPILDIEISDLATNCWLEVMRRVWTRAREITDLRYSAWDLRKFEYQHFYSAWVGIAFRFRACAKHHQEFKDVFQRTKGGSEGLDLYMEDDSLFGFFIKGLSALESTYYGLYALGALIDITEQAPLPPSEKFSLLDPSKPQKWRKITSLETLNTFKIAYPGHPITMFLEYTMNDTMYQDWSQIRNILAHRVTTAGRIQQYSGPFLFPLNAHPISVTQWAGDFPLDETMTTIRYNWLKETLNNGLEIIDTFVRQQLPYSEDKLPSLQSIS